MHHIRSAVIKLTFICELHSEEGDTNSLAKQNSLHATLILHENVGLHRRVLQELLEQLQWEIRVYHIC